MELRITLGSIIRFINTLGAAHMFAAGNIIFGTILAGLVVGSAYLEGNDPETPESP